MKKLVLFIAFVCASYFANAQASCQAHFTYSESALAVSFVDSSYGSTTPSNWSWNFGDGETSTLQSPSHTYNLAGTYVVCLTIYTPFTNCQSTYCDSIVVGNQGNCYTYFTQALDSINPNKVNFWDSVSAGVITWQWDFGDAVTSNAQSPFHIYAGNGTYNVCLTTTDSLGCGSTYCDSVTIGSNGNCSSAFSYTLDFINPNTILFSDNSTPNSVSAVWNFSDGTIDSTQHPTHIFQGPGIYAVCLTMEDSTGCSNTSCQEVVVGPVSCSANFSFVPDSVSLLTLHFTNTSLGDATGWIWDFGDGDSVYTQSASHTFNLVGAYNVCLTITDSVSNCIDTYCQTLDVSNCYASYTYVADSTDPYTVHLIDQSLGNPTSWLWDFEDGTTSTLQNPVHTYPFDAWHWVCLTTTNSNNCTSTYCDFVYAGQPSNCYEYWEFTPDSADALTISFHEYSWGAPPSAYFWEFGDGDTSHLQNPVHTYDTAGVYFVCCTISDSTGNCSFADCYNLNVGNFSNCPATFTQSMLSATIASFSYTGTGNPTGYLWDFGVYGTSTQPAPANNFLAPGTYSVCLTITDSGCTSTHCDSVTIVQVGQEEMLLDNSFSVYPNPAMNNLFIQNNSQNAGVVILSVFNPLGELVDERVMNNSREMLDFSDKAAGLYSVKIQNQNSVIHKKVMIVK